MSTPTTTTFTTAVEPSQKVENNETKERFWSLLVSKAASATAATAGWFRTSQVAGKVVAGVSTLAGFVMSVFGGFTVSGIALAIAGMALGSSYLPQGVKDTIKSIVKAIARPVIQTLNKVQDWLVTAAAWITSKFKGEDSIAANTRKTVWLNKAHDRRDALNSIVGATADTFVSHGRKYAPVAVAGTIAVAGVSVAQGFGFWASVKAAFVAVGTMFGLAVPILTVGTLLGALGLATFAKFAQQPQTTRKAAA